MFSVFMFINCTGNPNYKVSIVYCFPRSEYYSTMPLDAFDWLLSLAFTNELKWLSQHEHEPFAIIVPVLWS